MNTKRQYSYKSQFADNIQSLIAEKRGLGIKFYAEAGRLQEIDRFVIENNFTDAVVTKEMFNLWSIKRPNESESNRVLRVGTMQRFSQYLTRMGYVTYISNVKLKWRNKAFKAYIFTDVELSRLLRAAHEVKCNGGSKVRHIVVPMLFTMLACTGIRIGEALSMKRSDVTFKGDHAFLFIRSPKYDRDRNIPLTTGLSGKLRKYLTEINLMSPKSELLFPCKGGGEYYNSTMHYTFRELLYRAGISYGGCGKGPRIQDLRHTFTVKSLRKLALANADPQTVYPFLSKYLGHKSLSSTQGYIQLTAELFPYIIKNMEEYCGYIVPCMEGYDGEESY